MLYIIAGSSRSGKTIVAKKMKLQKGISFLSLDWLVMGFTNGIPEFGINDKLFPDEIAEKFWCFFKAMCENMIWGKVDYIFEGEAVLPELMVELLKKYPNQIRICFIGYTQVNIDQKVKNVKEFSDGEGDWLSNEPDEYIISHIKNMMVYSRRIRKSCRENNIKYFDTSENFIAVVDSSVKYLME